MIDSIAYLNSLGYITIHSHFCSILDTDSCDGHYILYNPIKNKWLYMGGGKSTKKNIKYYSSRRVYKTLNSLLEHEPRLTKYKEVIKENYNKLVFHRDLEEELGL